jgi:GAF domain-containing protein
VFAEQAALAVANARLYEAERAHVAALLDLRKKREAG